MSEPIAVDTSSGVSGSIFEGPRYLVESVANGGICLNQDVLQEVASLQDKKLVVVCVAGPYRSGKSYVMNRLAGKNSGFALGSTIQPVTKGIWIWVRDHPEYPDQYLVLLDTEGLGDPTKGDAAHDCHIFCLATLLSSVLIYNQMGVINDKALQELNFISEMSRHLQTHQEKNPGKNADEDFDYYFPQLIYLLRDFCLDSEVDGKILTSDEYLEHCLELKSDTTKAGAHQFNEVRKCIRRYFKNRKCVTFDRPVSSRSQLKLLETLSDSDLSPDFLKEVNEFCQHIFVHSPIKKLEDGHPFNGRMWSTLVHNLVESIQNGVVPCIENAVDAMAAIENTRAVDETVAFYLQTMWGALSMPTPDQQRLTELHQQTLKAAIKHFLDKAVFDHENIYQEKANVKIQEEYAKLEAANKEASVTKCREVFERLGQPLAEALKNGIYSKPGGYKEYQQAVEGVINHYQAESGLGTQKDVILQEYRAKSLREGEGILAADQALTEKEKLAEAERVRATEAEEGRLRAEQAREQTEREARERENTLQENLQQLEQKSQQELAELQSHNESVLNSRLAEQQRLLQEGFSAEVATLNQEIQNLKNRPPPRRRRRRGKCVIS